MIIDKWRHRNELVPYLTDIYQHKKHEKFDYSKTIKYICLNKLIKNRVFALSRYD